MQIQTDIYQIHTKYKPNNCQSMLANPMGFVPVCMLDWYVFVCICKDWVCIGLYTTNTIQINTDHMEILIIGKIYLGLYWFVLVCNGMYEIVLTCIVPNHLYFCIKTPFSDDQKVFVYYKHNTDQY